jgi:3-methyladenine DNA glycosylase/8-oxoguanine DNA glycosylase
MSGFATASNSSPAVGNAEAYHTVIPVRDYDLGATLAGGQAFRWNFADGAWDGVIGRRWVRLRTSRSAASITAETSEPVGDWKWLTDYLQTGLDLSAVLATFPDDEPMQAAVNACRGLRLLRQDPWECLASFILSSTKQIVQIRQIVARLCERFGEPVAVPPASKERVGGEVTTAFIPALSSGEEFPELSSRSAPLNRSNVARAFQSRRRRDSGDFPVPSIRSTGLESPANPQTGMSALRGSGAGNGPSLRWERSLTGGSCPAQEQLLPLPRERLGVRANDNTDPVILAFTFPTAERLARATETQLRACKMGFRAPYLLATARCIARGRFDLDRLRSLPLEDARAALMTFPGVGHKIADCVLLFAYGFPTAFPVDVWVMKALRQLYFSGRRVTERRLREFSGNHFGPNAGYAQQYLFHYMRTRTK